MTNAELLEGFAGFVSAARRLEERYARLEERAAAVDLELARTNERLSATLDERERVFCALPVGVAAVDARGDAIWSNPEADRLRALFDVARWSAIADGEHRLGAVTVRVRRAELPQRGELIVLEDRTRVVDLEREVQRLDRLAGLSELALGVAHEIRNPLNGVLGYASLMRRCDDPQRLRSFADRLAEGVEQVDAIVAAMLEFARPVRQSDPCLTSFAVVVERATAEAALPSRSVTVTGATGEACDAIALGRVLANLLRNAKEAAADREPAVRVDAAIAGDELTVTVADDGPGIPAELAGRLFEPFVTSKATGHGLGLALAARVLSFLGGSIELVRADGGAVFRVRLPRAVAGRPR
ncbi:MAG: hypothetical protein IPM29_30895 [Planctomycetes bacterium]|nr:hypothetical protein [Planctomycetota bacterium]